MIILNWLPELAILIQLFICLVCLNFKPLTYRSLSLCIAIFSGMVLFYFVGRSDLAYFTPSEKILSADSLSYFGRIFSLIVLTFGSLSLHFHSQLPYHSKQTANLFLLFLAAFMNILVLSNSVLLLAVGWMGCYLSVSNIILIESGNHFRWVQMIRQHTFSFAAAIALFGALFVLMGSSSSLYISDYMEWLKSAQDQFHVLFATGAVILVLGVTLTHSMVLKGKGPLGLALSSLFLFIIGAFFWFRIGVPFLTISGLLPKTVAQLLLGVIFGEFSLRYMVHALRTTEHDHWLSMVFASVVGLGWFVLSLKGEQALPAFYSLSLSFLFTFFLAGRAFLESEYKNKLLILIGIVALIGAPPFEMGFQFFRLIHDSIALELVPIALMVAFVWFGISLSAIQMMGKVILVKNGNLTFRKLDAGEVFFLVLFLVCVTLLTAYRPALILLLNDHPAPNLW